MGRAVKITISLPSDTLDVIEKERRARHETRSEFLRSIVVRALHDQRQRAEIERYVRGYEQWPETDEEVQLHLHIGRAVLAQEPWE